MVNLPPNIVCFHFNKNPCSKNSFQTLRLCQWDKHNAFVLLVSKSQNIYENWVIVVINNDQKTWQNRSQKVMRVESGNKIQWGSWSAPLKNWLPEVLKTFWCFYVLFSCVNRLKRLKGRRFAVFINMHKTSLLIMNLREYMSLPEAIR